MFDALCELALDPHRCNWSKHAVLPLLMLVAASGGGAKKSTRLFDAEAGSPQFALEQPIDLLIV